MKPTLGWKFKLAAVAVVATGLSVVGAESPKPPPAQEQQPAAAPRGRLLVTKDCGFDVIAPDGKKLAAVSLGKDLPNLGWLSPDSKQVAYIVPNTEGEKPKYRAALRDALGGPFVTTIDVEAHQLCWSPDGKTLAVSRYTSEDMIETLHSRIDLTARTVEKLDWPTDVRPLEWARDGKSVLVCKLAKDLTLLLARMSPDGKMVTDLVGLRSEDWGMVDARLSPDGRRVLYSDIPPGKSNEYGDMNRRLYVFDVVTKKRSEVADVPLNATVFFCCWSPDGNKIAYVWRQRHAALADKQARREPLSAEEMATETEMFVVVANADGTDVRTVAAVKGTSVTDLPFKGIEWR